MSDLAGGRPLRLRVAGAEVLLREWGEPDAPAVLYWHGLSVWGPWELLESGPGWSRGAGVRLLAVSAPGWETPPLADYSMTALARLLVAVLDALGLERAAFVGFSWGASIGSHLAADFPARLESLVLLDAGYTDVLPPAGQPEPTLAELVASYRAQDLRFRGFQEYEAHMRPRFRSWRPAVAAAVRAGMREEGGWVVPRVPAEVVAAGALGGMRQPPSRRLPEVGRAGVPLLLLASDATLATRYGREAFDRFRRQLPGADVEVLSSSHYLLVDAPARTVATVGRWLGAHGTGAAGGGRA